MYLETSEAYAYAYGSNSAIGSIFVGVFVFNIDPDEIVVDFKLATAAKSANFKLWETYTNYAIDHLPAPLLNTYPNENEKNIAALISQKANYLKSILEIELKRPLVLTLLENSDIEGLLGEQIWIKAKSQKVKFLMESFLKSRFQKELIHLDHQYPEYKFLDPAGDYKALAILKYGPCPMHRKSALKFLAAGWLKLLEEDDAFCLFQTWVVKSPPWWESWFGSLPWTYWLSSEQIDRILRLQKPVYPKAFRKQIRAEAKEYGLPGRIFNKISYFPCQDFRIKLTRKVSFRLKITDDLY